MLGPSAHPGVLASKIFLFNFPFDLPGADDKLSVTAFPDDELVVFPPVAASTPQLDILQAHAAEFLGDLAVRLLLGLDEQVRLLERSLDKETAAATPLQFLKAPLTLLKGDSEGPRFSFGVFKSSKARSSASDSVPESSGEGLEAGFDPTLEEGDSTLLRKGKLLKWMGDVSLRVCSPLDALHRYAHSLGILRSHSLSEQEQERGAMLHGLALEGVSASLGLAHECGITQEEVIAVCRSFEDLMGKSSSKSNANEWEASSTLDLAVKFLEDALQLYRKRPGLAAMRVASFVKLATLLTVKLAHSCDDLDVTMVDQKSRVNFRDAQIICIDGSVGCEMLHTSISSGLPS